MVKLKNIVVLASAAIFLGGFMLWGILQPDKEQSISERRPLAQLPECSWESLLSGAFMEDFGRYSLDQFPLREQFRRIKAVTVLDILRQKDNNGIYISGGFASKLEYPMDTDSMDYAASRLRFVYDRYMAGGNMRVFFSIIPDKNFFMASENGYPALDYEAFAAGMKDRLDFAEYIDIYSQLELSGYYRTDSHWRQEKIVGAAERLAAGMGAVLSGEYELHDADLPFYGVYYGQSALPMPPDRLCYLSNDILNNCKVFDYETDSWTCLYDLERAAGRDPYEMFLSGPKSLMAIENPNADCEKELILFRDSFGSSIAPLLAQGYSKVTLVDIRYISPGLLDRYISFDNQDVLFLYSVPVLNHSETFK